MKVTINDTPIPVPVTIHRDLVIFGDYLDWIETIQIRSGHCITNLAINGTETINYRETAVLEIPALEITELAVKTAQFDIVIREILEELKTELAKVISLTSEIIKDFENHEDEKTHTKLAEFLESIGILTTIFSEDIGWKYGDTLGTTIELNTNLERAITQLISAQKKKFWVSICDILEFELQPILENWQKIIENTLSALIKPTPEIQPK